MQNFEKLLESEHHNRQTMIITMCEGMVRWEFHSTP